MKMLWIFLLCGLVIAGTTFLLGALKDNKGLFRKGLVVSGAAIAVLVFFGVSLAGARSGDDKIFWELLGLLALLAVCVTSGLFVLWALFFSKKDGGMGRGLRLCCFGLALFCCVVFVLVKQREEIATALQRRAVAAGESSALGVKIAWRLQKWEVLTLLAPSPQKDRLLGMISPAFWPPEDFWPTVLSLPPSPERLAVITTFAYAMMHDVKALVTLYDQGDCEGLDVVFRENAKSYFGYWLGEIVALQRPDILRNVLRRGRGRIDEEGQISALIDAVDLDNPELLALLLDSGIKPDAGEGRSALGRAAMYNKMKAARLLLERGADVNRECLVLDSVDNVAMLSLLLEKGASPLCARSGRTLLHQAAWYDVDSATLDYLRGLGLDMNARDDDGRTPLLLAAWYGSYSVLEYLINAGADISLRDGEGNTVLHELAQGPQHARHQRRNEEGGPGETDGANTRASAILARLVALRPDLMPARNAEGKTALEYARDAQSIALLQGGAQR